MAEEAEKTLNVGPWTCFHCGETFTTVGSAVDHFGTTPNAKPGCLIARVPLENGTNTQIGRGLLMALRAAEAEIADLRRAIGEPRKVRDCTCLGVCKGREGLAPGWKCALDASC